jgi:predicted dehydrogenase
VGASQARFALVGSGWRSAFFLRLASQAPERFAATGVVTRTAERGAQVEAQWKVPSYRSISQLLAAERPEFVIPCVPWSQTAPATIQLVEAGVPVLAETPPAADLEGLRTLWTRVGPSGLVQVAEQYLRMPAHAARLALVRRGVIGEVTSVQVSSTHLYHAVSMIRGLLDVGTSPVTIRAQAFAAPLANPLNPNGWTGSAEPEELTTTLATLDFGAARMGPYDFTDNQWWNPLRQRRIVIRGTMGEIVDDQVIRLEDPYTPVESRLIRRQAGIDLNLEGVDLQHISFDGEVVYRNDFAGARFSDDDLAVADLLAAMAAWCRGDGPAPYPLSDGCQDHLVGLAIMEASRTGQPVTTSSEEWSKSHTSFAPLAAR